MKRSLFLRLGLLLATALAVAAAGPAARAPSKAHALKTKKDLPMAMNLEQVSKDLERLEMRVRQREESKHDLAPYLKEQAAIVERLIAAIEEDRARTDPFFQREAALEESECSTLLASLKEELDLIERNENLAAEAKSKTVNVRDVGAAGDGKRDDGPALNEAIARAAAMGPGAKVVIPAGRYAMSPLEKDGARCHLLLSGVSDLTVEAEAGTTLVMKGVAGGVVVQNCRNVLIRSLAIDYDPLPFTQGKIVAVHSQDNAFEMEIDRGFPAPTLEYFRTAGILRGTVRFADGGDIDRAGGDPRISRVERIGPNRYRLTAKRNDGSAPPGLTSGFKVGQMFSLHARGAEGAGPGVSVAGSRYVTLEGVRVYAAFDHAYYSRESEGLKLRGCVAEPLPGSGRLGCNNADGFHCPSNRKGPFLENCRFRFVNDDCANIYSKCYALAKSLSPVDQILDLAVGGVAGEPLDTPLYRPGDAVAIVNPNDGEVEEVARVAAVTRAEWRGKPRLALRLDRPIEGLVSREALGKPPIAGREYLWGKSKGPIEHFFVNLNTKGDGFVIRGCEFGHNRASGIKVKCSNGVVENTRIEHPAGACLHLLVELAWREGWAPRNVILRHNTFDHARRLTSTYGIPYRANPGPRFIRRVSIEDNTFLGASDYAIRLNSAQDIQVVNNRIQSSHPVKISNCDHIRVGKNVFEMPEEAGGEAVEVADRSDKDTIEIRDNRFEPGR